MIHDNLYDNPKKTVVTFEDGTVFSFTCDPDKTVCENEDSIRIRAEAMGHAYGWGLPITYKDSWV